MSLVRRALPCRHLVCQQLCQLLQSRQNQHDHLRASSGAFQPEQWHAPCHDWTRGFTQAITARHQTTGALTRSPLFSHSSSALRLASSALAASSALSWQQACCSQSRRPCSSCSMAPLRLRSLRRALACFFSTCLHWGHFKGCGSVWADLPDCCTSLQVLGSKLVCRRGHLICASVTPCGLGCSAAVGSW